MVRIPKKVKSINALGHRRGRRAANRYNAEQQMAEKMWKRGWKQIPEPETTGSMSDYWPGLRWEKTVVNADGDELLTKVIAKDVYGACHLQASIERKQKQHLKPENIAAYLIEKGWKQSGPLADVWTIPHWATKNKWGRPYDHKSQEACFSLSKAYQHQLKVEHAEKVIS